MIKLILFSFLFLNVYSQDPSFCDLNNIIPQDDQNIPLPTFNVTQRYQSSIEKNSDELSITEEISEFYDGIDNVAIAVTTLAGNVVGTYSYYNINELLLVKGTQCKVLKLDENIDETPFQVTIVNGKEQLITPLGLALTSARDKFKYFSSRNLVRGIPVRQWIGCIGTKDQSTIKVTLSFSNEKLWTPAVPDTQSIPVEIIYEKKKPNQAQIVKEVYTITQFKRFLLLQEADYFTPSGVYCPNRFSLKDVPKVPDSFSFTAHLAFSEKNLDDLAGTLRVVRIEQDFKKQLSRTDYFNKGIRYTDIVDIKNAVQYTLNRYHDNCTIANASIGGSGLISIDPSNFFDFDKEPKFQYVGQRLVREINTDVWIAPREFSGVKTMYEWYFSTSDWNVQEANAQKQLVPIMLKIIFDLPDPASGQIAKAPLFIHITGFDETRIDLFDFDIGRCHQKNTHFVIEIAGSKDNYQIMKNNQIVFRESIIMTIQEITQIPLIRISLLELIFDNDIVYVTFTLLEKLESSKDEVSLNDVTNKLKTAFDQKKLKFTFFASNNQKYEITPERIDETERRSDRFVFKYTDSNKVNGYSSGSVFGFVIGFLLVGLVLGLVGGVFLILKRNSSIQLPGPLSFFNPNFKQTQSA